MTRGLFVFLLLLVGGVRVSLAAPPKNATDAILAAVVKSKKGSFETLSPLFGRPMARPLSKAEMGALSGIVDHGAPDEAGYAALVLATCGRNPVAERLPVMVRRFVAEVSKPAPAKKELTHITLLSARVGVYDYFLQAFSRFGNPAVPVALKAELKKTKVVSARKWLQIALGILGFSDDKKALMEMARSDADNSLRICAIRAYTRAAGNEAIPLLQELENDKTVTGTDSVGPIYGIQAAVLEEERWMGAY